MPFELEGGTDFIGLEAADQIWLENDVSVGGGKWPRCCCAASPVHACDPDTTAYCQSPNEGIPAKDLTLTWTLQTGGTCYPTETSITLHYNNNATTPFWTSYCQSTTGSCGTLHPQMIFTMDCNSFLWRYYNDNYPCPGSVALQFCCNPTQTSPCSVPGQGITLVAITCDPFHIQFDMVGPVNTCSGGTNIKYLYVDE